jgi:uncharacterized RDD family membrane protein YckC
MRAAQLWQQANSQRSHRARVSRLALDQWAVPVSFRATSILLPSNVRESRLRRGARTATAFRLPGNEPGRRVEREPEALSTSTIAQPNAASSWKQEVSRRVAAHQNRRGISTALPAVSVPSWQGAGSRAAQAAARVAARYAQAPSYSQMLNAETQAAEPAAEIPIPVSRTAQAVSDAPAISHMWEPESPMAVVPARSAVRDSAPAAASALPAAPSSLDAWESENSAIRWEPDLRLRPLEAATTPASAEMRWGVEELEPDEIEPVEPDLPIHANLIEFPRELVATRKIRPRRAEGLFVVEGSGKQLSIFEVDPCDLSTGAEATGAEPATAWPEPDWSDIALEAQPQDEVEPLDALPETLALQLAPIGNRLLAALVDGALIAGIGLGSALTVKASFGHPFAARIVELTAALALLLAGLVYQTLFLTLAEATPGMRCAGLSLCTFDGQIPTRAQLRSRLGALFLSIVPVGLGIAWSLFDEDHLCWHDRLSRTYLRQS